MVPPVSAPPGGPIPAYSSRVDEGSDEALRYLVELFRALTFLAYRHRYTTPSSDAFQEIRLMFRDEQKRVQDGLVFDWSGFAQYFWPSPPEWLLSIDSDVGAVTQELHETAQALAGKIERSA